MVSTNLKLLIEKFSEYMLQTCPESICESLSISMFGITFSIEEVSEERLTSLRNEADAFAKGFSAAIGKGYHAYTTQTIGGTEVTIDFCVD